MPFFTGVIWLTRFNGSNAVAFEEISRQDCQERHGISKNEVMSKVYDITAAGNVISGVERRSYNAFGLGWIMAPTERPVLKQVADLADTIFVHSRAGLRRGVGRI